MRRETHEITCPRDQRNANTVRFLPDYAIVRDLHRKIREAQLTKRNYIGFGICFIDKSKARPEGRLRNNTRLSVCVDGEYVAIMEVQLPDGTELCAGLENSVFLRLVAGRALSTSDLYEIRDPIDPIGWLRLTEIALDNG